MMSEVDLSQLVVDRGEKAGPSLRARRHLFTRYLLPAGLIIGFVILIAWAARDLVFPPRRVTVVPVLATQAESQRAGTPLFNAAGWVEPRPTPVRAAALASGVVEQLLVVEDQAVKAGEPLAVLIKDDAILIHDRAKADLGLRQAELAQMKVTLVAATTRLEQPVHLQAELGEAAAELASLETQLTNLPFQLRRAEADHAFTKKDHEGKVAAKEAVSGRAVDEAMRELTSAKALVEELQRREASLESEVAALAIRLAALKTRLELLADEIEARDAASAKVQAAEARVQQATVALAEAKLQLDRMTVRSPIDGRVYQLIAHPGARIGFGMMTQMQGHDGSTVVTLYRPDRLQVRVDVRFEDVPKVRLGQTVRIKSPAASEPLAGTVLFVSSLADIQKNTLQIKVEIKSPTPVFKPEMLVDATFLAPEESADSTQSSQQLRVFLPRTLVHQDADGAYVWLADQTAGVAQRTPVTTGFVGANGLVEIVSGLTISSRIIVSGSDGLKDGERIQVTGEEMPEGMTKKE